MRFWRVALDERWAMPQRSGRFLFRPSVPAVPDGLTMDQAGRPVCGATPRSDMCSCFAPNGGVDLRGSNPAPDRAVPMSPSAATTRDRLYVTESVNRHRAGRGYQRFSTRHRKGRVERRIGPAGRRLRFILPQSPRSPATILPSDGFRQSLPWMQVRVPRASSGRMGAGWPRTWVCGSVRKSIDLDQMLDAEGRRWRALR